MELTAMDVHTLKEVKAKINEISKRYKGTPVGSALVDIEYKIDELRFQSLNKSMSAISINRLIKGR